MSFEGPIALNGPTDCGKDTIADYLCQHHGYRKVAFSTPMKEWLIDIDPVYTHPPTWLLDERTPMQRLESWKKNNLFDTRSKLQRLGMKFREHFGDSFWIDLALRDAGASPDLFGEMTLDYKKVIFTDCRFPLEGIAVLKLGGEIVHIEREGTGPIATTGGEVHVSETSAQQVKEACCGTVYNNGTVQEAAEALLQMLEEPGDVEPARRRKIGLLLDIFNAEPNQAPLL